MSNGYIVTKPIAPNVANGNGSLTSNGLAKSSSIKQQSKIPFPQSSTDVSLLLERYRALMDAEHSNVEDEKLEIERTLYEISQAQKKYSGLSAKLEQIKSERTSEPVLDLDLLKKQIVGLQLLSKDLDLPTDLQYDLGAASYGAREGQVAEEPAVETGHEEDESSANHFKFDYSDYFVRAEQAGIKLPSNEYDAMHDVVGNYYSEQMISNKISNRVKELSKLPSNLGTFDFEDTSFRTPDQLLENGDEQKIKSLVELKSLNILTKQKQVRQNLISSMALKAHGSKEYENVSLSTSAQRALYVRPKNITPNTDKLLAELERQQKREKEQLDRKLHLRKVSQMLTEAEDIIMSKQNKETRRFALFKQISHYHQQVEKDESKKLEKNAKQRLQALKANDEEAYLKLIDTAKDTRITHLLEQTNSFLDSLSQAVRAQQNDSMTVHGDIVEDLNPEVSREKIDYYDVAHKIKESVSKQPSILVGGTLKEYQVKGLEWMVSLYNNHLNGILADEMGLGKTIQSISLITYLIESKHEQDKFLVIVPLSTITNWTLEFEKWAPSVNTIVYKGSPNQRKLLQYDIRNGDFTVLLTTYEYIIKDRPLLSKFRWAHMIIDEGHRMKNSQSKLSYTLTNYYHTKHRLILTGTPLQNNLPELWALLNFVLPKIFNSVKSFDEWFNTPFANTGSQDKMELTEEESLLVIRRLHKVLRPFLLRRLKKDVEKDLPDKIEKVVKCKLSDLQYALYQQMLNHNALFVGSNHGASKSGIKGLNNKIMQLRKICNHPFVFEEVEDLTNPSRITNDTIWRTSGKFELLDRVLPKFKVTGHRVLMFFQMTQVMDIMEDFLRYRGMNFLRLDGSTKAEDRTSMLKDFNAPNSEYFCFLLSTRAGGLGLNLQTADTVIIFDTDWNPHQDLQAQDRAHRIGQKNEVRILRLITDDSVEEVILARAHQKLDIDGKVIQAGKFDNKSTAEEQEAFLKRLIEAEQDKRGNDEDDELDEDELNEILARNDGEKELFAQMDAERMATAKIEGRKRGGKPLPRLITNDELPSVFTEDITIHLNPVEKELGRTRDKKTVVYDDGLTEEQWLEAMDDDEDSVEDAVARKQESLKKRRESRLAKLATLDEEALTPKKRSSRSASATPLDDDDSLLNLDDSDFQEPSKKKKNGRREVSKLGSEIDVEFVNEANGLIDEMLTLKSEVDGHSLTDIFMNLPPKKDYPDYYQFIRKPIAIKNIKKSLNSGTYSSLDDFVSDLKTMFTNAKTYNEEGSWVYTDAEFLEEFVDSRVDGIGARLG